MEFDPSTLEPLMEHALAEKLGRVSRQWRSVVDRYLNPLGLTHPRWTALWKLARIEGDVTQKRLADALEIELPSLMRTLGQLEAQGYIQRFTSEHDRRARLVVLTSSGQELLTEMTHRITTIRQSLLANISVSQLTQFEETLAQISTNALDLEQKL